MYRFLDPKNDLAFKKVFGTEQNKAILINFLNDVLEGEHEKIEDVDFLKTSLDPEIAALRQSIVDVLCRDKNGNSLLVEMQYSNDSHFIKRAVSYASRAYLDQRKKRENETKSGGYEDMRRVIFFAIMAKPLFSRKQKYLSHPETITIVSGEMRHFVNGKPNKVWIWKAYDPVKKQTFAWKIGEKIKKH
jgi:predicted transposase/invertase (TIGR01784 family)